MRFIIKYFFLVIISMNSHKRIAAAQNRWTIKEIINYVSENSPLIKAEEKNISSKKYLSTHVIKWDNPTVNFNSGSYSISPYNGMMGNLTILQDIPFFGQKKIEKNLIDKEIEIVENELKKNKIILRNQVLQICYKLASINQQYIHVSHRKEKINSLNIYLKNKQFVSPSQEIEKNLIENRLREIEQKLIMIKSERDNLWYELNQYLGLSEMIIPQINWNKNPSLPNKAEFLKMLTQNNLEILIQNQKIEYSNLEVLQAEFSAYPEIRIGAGIYDQIVPKANDHEYSYLGIVEFKLPLWNQGHEKKKSAEAKSEMEQYYYEQTKVQVLNTFNINWSKLENAKERIEIFPESLIKKLEEQILKAEMNWRKNLVTAMAFLEIENQVHDQIVNIYQAQTDYYQFLSELHKLVNQDILY